MKEVKKLFIEESKVNKGCMMLIAVDEDGNKWVVSGDSRDCRYLIKHEDSFDTKPLQR